MLLPKSLRNKLILRYVHSTGGWEIEWSEGIHDWRTESQGKCHAGCTSPSPPLLHPCKHSDLGKAEEIDKVGRSVKGISPLEVSSRTLLMLQSAKAKL